MMFIRKIQTLVDTYLELFTSYFGYFLRGAILRPRLKQKFDLRIAIAMNDRIYGYLVRATILRFIFSALAFLYSATSYALHGGSWSVTLSLLVSAIAAYFAFRTMSVAQDAIGQFRVADDFFATQTEPLKQLNVRGQPVAFASIAPSQSELRAGFTIKASPRFSSDAYSRSSRFDNQIAIRFRAPIPYSEDPAGSRHFLARSHGQDDPKRIDQLRYLVARAEQPQELLNDDKFGLSWRLSIPPSPISIHRMGYFDAIVTNEFFRSRLVRWPRQVDKAAASVEEVGRYDKYFPLEFSADGTEISLPAFPVPTCGNQVGITTLAVTSDGAVLFFRQGNKQAIAAGEVVASGSGSVNYSDLACASDPNDFSSVIRFAMARELLEEAKERGQRGLPINPWKNADPKKVRELSLQTRVTGFFRWVNRAGKPEFVGVTRLSERSGVIVGDNREVQILGLDIQWPSVQKMEDFKQIREIWLPEVMSKLNTQTSLSSFLCLNRLCEIADYRNSTDPEEEKIFKDLNALLFPGD